MGKACLVRKVDERAGAFGGAFSGWRVEMSRAGEIKRVGSNGSEEKTEPIILAD